MDKDQAARIFEFQDGSRLIIMVESEPPIKLTSSIAIDVYDRDLKEKLDFLNRLWIVIKEEELPNDKLRSIR